jgi:acetate kinase
MKSRVLHVLALNSGSSSLKFGLYRVGPALTDLLISGRGWRDRLRKRKLRGRLMRATKTFTLRRRRFLRRPMRSFGWENCSPSAGCPRLSAVGHRIVHGGPKLLRHCLIDAAVLSELEAAAVFAPLHTPPALAVIRCASGAISGTCAGRVL